MSVYDIGSSADSKTALVNYIAKQDKTFKFWIKDASISNAACPRYEYTAPNWNENVNPTCTDKNAALCQYIDPACKFSFLR